MSGRVVIVGAGPGGLATAMLLARAGLEVDVLERMSWVGGRTTSFGAGGYRFDLGPTFFHYPRVLAEIFAAAGRDLAEEVDLRLLDPQYRLVFGAGGELLTSPDRQTMEKAVAEFSPRDAGSFTSYMDENADKLTRLRPLLENPHGGVRDLFRRDVLGALPVIKPGRTLHDELARHFSDPRLQTAFTFQSKYLGMSPFECPSVFSILPYLEYQYGIYHPIGGFGAITEAMARVATELGARIHLDEEVDELLFEGRRVVGARTSGSTWMADAVVMNADFARGIRKLVPEHLRPSWSDRKVESRKYSCSTFMLYLGIEGCYEDLEHHTIYVAEDYRDNLEDIEKRHVLSGDPSFYVQNATVTDPTAAPVGHSTLYVLVPVTHQHQNVDWAREKEPFRDRVIRQLEKVGITGLEERIRFEKVITPDDWSEQYEVHRGAVFNMAHSLGQMLGLRPRNRFDDVDGLFLTGGGTHPGSGLPVIFESARISSRLLAGDLGVDFPEVDPIDGDELLERLRELGQRRDWEAA